MGGWIRMPCKAIFSLVCLTRYNTSAENFSFLHVDYIDLTQVINILQKANESSFQLMKTNYHSNQSVNLHRSINFV
jgi:hypothetical protein